jgi:hypothetical protein
MVRLNSWIHIAARLVLDDVRVGYSPDLHGSASGTSITLAGIYALAALFGQVPPIVTCDGCVGASDIARIEKCKVSISTHVHSGWWRCRDYFGKIPNPL